MHAHQNQGPSDMQHVRFLPKTQTEEEVVPLYRTIAQRLEHTPRQSWADFPSPKGPAEALPLLLTTLHWHARENREMSFGAPCQALFQHLILLFSTWKHIKYSQKPWSPVFSSGEVFGFKTSLCPQCPLLPILGSSTTSVGRSFSYLSLCPCFSGSG